jgi:hypothetical protein
MGLVRREPVLMVGAGLNGLILMFFAFFPGFHLTSAELAAIGTISTALCALVGAFLTTPPNQGIISASISTILVAAAAFGLHLSPHTIAVVAAGIVTVMSYLLRHNVSPVVGQAPAPAGKL